MELRSGSVHQLETSSHWTDSTQSRLQARHRRDHRRHSDLVAGPSAGRAGKAGV